MTIQTIGQEVMAGDRSLYQTPRWGKSQAQPTTCIGSNTNCWNWHTPCPVTLNDHQVMLVMKRLPRKFARGAFYVFYMWWKHSEWCQLSGLAMLGDRWEPRMNGREQQWKCVYSIPGSFMCHLTHFHQPFNLAIGPGVSGRKKITCICERINTPRVGKLTKSNYIKTLWRYN